ncbi:MAG: hypothetical protein U0U70_14310 [Chitinophagaceae bacterium]
MKTNIINWFRLNNWHDFNFPYRLVEVIIEGASNEPKEFNKAFFNARNFLSYETKGPVAPAYFEGKRYIAVKADAELSEKVITGSPLTAILRPFGEQQILNAHSMTDENLELALQFLESTIKYQLNRIPVLWDGGTNTFLKKFPLPLSGDIETDIYHGFKYKVVAIDKDNVFFCVDLAYKYAAKQNLHQVLQHYHKDRHNDLVSNRNFLYLNGDDWYTVKGKSVGSSIDKYVMPNGMTVYDYNMTQGKYAHARYKEPLLKNSETFFHTYTHNSQNSFAGAACLAKAIGSADNNLHKNSINEPNKRFMRIEKHVENYFQRLKFNGVQLQVSTRPLKKECKVFALPSLKFGKNAILNPYEGEVPYGRPIDHFPKRRREFIYNNGIISDTEFTPQLLFIPDDMMFNFGKSVKYYFDRVLKQIAPQFPGFIVHQYPMKSYPFASKVFSDLKKFIIEKNLTGSNAIFVLPEDRGDGGRFNRFLRNIIKKEFFKQVNFKCVSASKLTQYLFPGKDANSNKYFVPDGLMKHFKSYLANTLFEHLIINKKWAYALAKNLNNDLYIGIDAHEFYAGFCFFFGNGETIVFDVDKTAKGTGTFRNEKINYRVIEDKIVEVLKRNLEIKEHNPKSIVILRDGVSYGEEEKALYNALQRLDEMELLNKSEIKTGVMDVAKSSIIPARAASFVGNSNSLENPDSGTHFYMNKKGAFIFNTGAPFKVPGSSNPIHVSYNCGNVDFEETLEDIFVLTQVAFSSPDRPTSLPLPLKLIDTLIRDVAHEYDFATTTDKEANISTTTLNKKYERL